MHPAAQKLRERIATGQPVLGTMLVEFGGPAVVGVTANAGCDFILLDYQHFLGPALGSSSVVIGVVGS